MTQAGIPEQARTATAALRGLLGDAVLAVYLHGSAVSGGLQPHSDIDLLAVVDRPMTDVERRDLLSALLMISGRYPFPSEGPRSIEVMVFVLSKLVDQDFPAQAEFTYGEWLRNAFEAGASPVPVHDPENILVLAQARQASRPLFGPNASELLPHISLKDVRRAMHDALPTLLHGLRGDERNVLLTLARMWRTARTGEFVSKDLAASGRRRTCQVRTPRHWSLRARLIWARSMTTGRVNKTLHSEPWSICANACWRVYGLKNRRLCYPRLQ